MIHFNQLTISPDGQHLTIDVSVLSEAYYKNVYIDSIIIDNQDTYVGSGPSSKPVYSYSVPDRTSKLTKKTYSQKHIRLDLTSADLNLDGLLFVYVRTKGTPSADTPCGMDNITTMGTVSNMYPFYQQAMNYIKELANNCSVPQNFTDYILRLKALELSVRTGNYPDAINYYNRFFSGKAKSSIRKGGCNCGNT
ncbi:MAG: hypothetical protein IJV29_18850 [Butyrivibrio sp.]|nr:hypothetical protein [Butyrivibrio sp.]MBQ7431672.1 hypothetical protein [Butyrivibrio sp.]